MVTLSTTFSDIAEIRDILDTLAAAFSTIKSDKNTIVTRMDTAGFEDLIPLSERAAGGVLAALDAGCSSYRDFFISRLIHRLMLEDFPRVDIPPNASTQEILAKVMVSMWQAMNAAAPDTVKSNSVTVGAVSATTTKTNAGTVATCAYLPGNVAPTIGGMANLYYYNVLTELAKTDTAVIECISDSFTTAGTSRGYEQFRISGLPSAPAPFSSHWTSDGDGTVGYLAPVQSRSALGTDLLFDNFPTTDNPNGWTITSGAAGTEINEESTSSKVVDGDFAAISGDTRKALALTGTCSLTYALTPDLVNGRAQMCLVLLLRKDGASAGTYTITVEGTGYSTVTSTALNAASLTTTYAALVMRVPIPAAIPSDFKIKIATSGISGGNILIDHGGFAEYQWWNGVGWAVYEGQDRFAIGDRFQSSITNNYAGDNQTTFAKCIRAQLPSTDPGSTYP